MRRKAIFIAAIVMICFAATAGYMLRPVCTPITDAELKSFNVPIEQRMDRDLYLKVFQEKEGHWYQCKTALSRSMFF